MASIDWSSLDSVDTVFSTGTPGLECPVGKFSVYLFLFGTLVSGLLLLIGLGLALVYRRVRIRPHAGGPDSVAIDIWARLGPAAQSGTTPADLAAEATNHDADDMAEVNHREIVERLAALQRRLDRLGDRKSATGVVV